MASYLLRHTSKFLVFQQESLLIAFFKILLLQIENWRVWERVTLILPIASSPIINRSLCMLLIMSGAEALRLPNHYYSLDYRSGS